MSGSGPGTPHPDGYGPPTTDVLHPGERVTARRARPAVLVTIGAVLGVAVLVGLAGLVLGGVGSGGDGEAAGGTGAGATVTGAPTAGGTATGATGTATTGPAVTTSPTRTTATASGPPAATIPPPTKPVGQPWLRPGNDFGALTDVQRRGDAIELVFNRQQFLNAAIGGPQWTAWVAENGQPENEYAIVDVNPRLRVFTVDEDAFFALTENLTGAGGTDSTVVTGDAFYTAVRSALDGAYRTGIPVWLFHSTTDLSSPVTGVQEQYLP